MVLTLTTHHIRVPGTWYNVRVLPPRDYRGTRYMTVYITPPVINPLVSRMIQYDPVCYTPGV